MTSGEDGIGSGTQVVGDVTAPVTVGGNAVGVLGDATATAPTPAPAAPATPAAPAAPAAEPTTSGQDGVASGTQVAPVVSVPVTVTGNGIGLLGDGTSTATGPAAPAAPTTPSAGGTTSGEDGIGSGTQVSPVVSLPVTIGGNGIGVVGDGTSTSTGGTGSGTGSTTPTAGGTTSGAGGLLSGTQIVPVISIPVTIGGNGIGVVGDGTSTTPGTGTDPGTPGTPAPR